MLNDTQSNQRTWTVDDLTDFIQRFGDSSDNVEALIRAEMKQSEVTRQEAIDMACEYFHSIFNG